MTKFSRALMISLKDAKLYERAIKEEVTKISLLRTISPTTVTGQFRRMAHGQARLTPYHFDFISPTIASAFKPMTLSFEVEPESLPPTNIHILIGRNGVGKTHLINNMIDSLIDGRMEAATIFGRFIPVVDDEGNRLFANLISVSFSAFDKFEPKQEIRDKSMGIEYSYIGLKQIKNGEKDLPPKSLKMLNDEFISQRYKLQNKFKNSSVAKSNSNA